VVVSNLARTSPDMMLCNFENKHITCMEMSKSYLSSDLWLVCTSDCMLSIWHTGSFEQKQITTFVPDEWNQIEPNEHSFLQANFVHFFGEPTSDLIIYTTPESNPGLVLYNFKQQERIKFIQLPSSVISFDIAPQVSLISCATAQNKLYIVEYETESDNYCALEVAVNPHKEIPKLLKFNPGASVLFSASKELLSTWAVHCAKKIASKHKGQNAATEPTSEQENTVYVYLETPQKSSNKL